MTDDQRNQYLKALRHAEMLVNPPEVSIDASAAYRAYHDGTECLFFVNREGELWTVKMNHDSPEPWLRVYTSEVVRNLREIIALIERACGVHQMSKLAESIAEVKRVSSLVKDTQPMWSEHLERVADAVLNPTYRMVCDAGYQIQFDGQEDKVLIWDITGKRIAEVFIDKR